VTYVPIFIKAMALAIKKNPEANQILFKKLFGYRIVRFERVDVNLPVTRKINGRIVTFVATVRDAPAKPLRQIQDEVSESERGEPQDIFAIRRFEMLSKMPFWLTQLIHWRMTRSPEFYVNNVGTCGLTFAEGGADEFIFPIAPTSVVFGIGGVQREAVVRGDEIAIARMQRCTLMVDNFVVPGPTGTRLGRDFKELLESGEFITAELTDSTLSRNTHG